MKFERVSWSLIVLVVAAFAVMFHAADALAFADDAVMGTFSCQANGTASGKLFISSASCPTNLAMDNFFSFLVCNFEQLSSDLMGHMFCGMVTNLKPGVTAAVTLATLFFGIAFTFGVIPATGREAMKFLLKVAFIMAFATNADYLIGYGYRFLLAGMSDGASIGLRVITAGHADIASAGDVYKELDKILATIFHYVTDQEGATDTANDEKCKNALFAVLALMAAMMPMLAYAGLLLIGRLLITLYRAVFAYVFAIVGIVFLLALAPFFLCFFLFKQTASLFERWLGYLVSFTLQVVLLFCFLGFVILVEKAVFENNVLQNLTNIVMYNEEAPEATSYRLNLSYCTLCDFKVVDKYHCTGDESACTAIEPNYTTTIPVPGSTTGETMAAGYVTVGKVVCKANPKKPITPNFATAGDNPDKSESKSQIKSLLTLMMSGIIPLILIAMLVENLLQLIPSLAQKLASNMNANYASQLGGGEAFGAAVARAPGSSALSDFGKGFERGFGSLSSGNGISKSVDAMRNGLSVMARGREMDSKSKLKGETLLNENGETRGATNSFSRWFTNPNRIGE